MARREMPKLLCCCLPSAGGSSARNLASLVLWHVIKIPPLHRIDFNPAKQSSKLLFMAARLVSSLPTFRFYDWRRTLRWFNGDTAHVFSRRAAGSANVDFSFTVNHRTQWEDPRLQNPEITGPVSSSYLQSLCVTAYLRWSQVIETKFSFLRRRSHTREIISRSMSFSRANWARPCRWVLVQQSPVKRELVVDEHESDRTSFGCWYLKSHVKSPTCYVCPGGCYGGWVPIANWQRQTAAASFAVYSGYRRIDFTLAVGRCTCT